MLRRPPRSTRTDTLFPYTTLFRSSNVLANAAPGRLFDRGLAGGPSRIAGDWYAEVAPEAYQELYAQVRLELGERASLPPHAAALTPAHRSELQAHPRSEHSRVGTECVRTCLSRW